MQVVLMMVQHEWIAAFEANAIEGGVALFIAIEAP